MNKIFDKINANWALIKKKLLDENEDISPAFFEAFIDPLKVVKFENKTLYIKVPEEMYINILEKRLINKFLKISISEIIDIPISSFEISFLADFYNSKYDNSTISKNILEKKLSKIKVDPKNTFENFIEGESNRLAYGCSVAVSDTPGEIYNPLVIYGGTGLGKTHLLHAISHHVLEKNEDFNILYISCQEFITNVYLSVKNHTIDDLKLKYKSLDMLIIDDIQFISNKTESQNILFDIFNSLWGEKKQIILSSDKPIKEIDNIDDRIKSRFSWGVSCDVKPPDLETRIAILLKKQEVLNPTFPIDISIIKYIAQSVKTNIRELEGSFKKIIAASNLEKSSLTLEQAKEILDISSQKNNNKITPEIIINTVSEVLDIPFVDICGKSRKTEFVYSRNISIYLCRKHIPDITQEKIGKYFGDRDHSTIIHSCKQIEKDIKSNKNLQEDIKTIEKRLFT